MSRDSRPSMWLFALLVVACITGGSAGLADWDVADVEAWVGEQGWAFGDQFIETLRTHQVTGRVLMHVEKADLKDEFGIASGLDRAKVMAALEELVEAEQIVQDWVMDIFPGWVTEVYEADNAFKKLMKAVFPPPPPPPPARKQEEGVNYDERMRELRAILAKKEYPSGKCIEGWAGAGCNEWVGEPCMEGWVGPDCDECAPGYSGEDCDQREAK